MFPKSREVDGLNASDKMTPRPQPTPHSPSLSRSGSFFEQTTEVIVLVDAYVFRSDENSADSGFLAFRRSLGKNLPFLEFASLFGLFLWMWTTSFLLSSAENRSGGQKNYGW